MGPLYRNMAKITLSWRFLRKIEEKPETFTVEIGQSERVLKLKEKITAQVREIKSDFCSNIDDDDDLNIKLWKVDISENEIDKFLTLRLRNDKKNGIEKLEETDLISKYWSDDLEKGVTHFVVYSIYLIMTLKSKKVEETNAQLNEKIEKLNEQIDNMSLQIDGW